VSDPTPHSFRELWSTYAQYARFVRPDARNAILCAITVVVAVATNTVMIWLLGMPFGLVQAGQFEDVARVLIGFGVVVVVNQAAQFSGAWFVNHVGLKFNARTRNAMLDRLLSASFTGAAQWAKGDVLARLSTDTDRVRYCLVDAPLYMFSHVLTAAIYVAMLFWIDLALALIALTATPLFIVQQRVLGRYKRIASERSIATYAALLAREEETLSNLRGISTAAAESFMAAKHRAAVQHARRDAMKERAVDIVFTTTLTLLIFGIGLLVVSIGIDGVRSERFSVGHLVSFLLYLGYLTVPARGVADILMQAFGNLPAAQRVAQILGARPTVTERDGARDIPVLRGGIELRHVRFGFSGERALFNDINLTIAPGETIALVGPSGAGKSTFAQLLLRFHDVDAGAVLIDGVDVRDIRLGSLRQHIAMVWQEPFLASGTLRENFLMYKPDATDAQIEHACAASHAWEFIAALPQRLDTRIGFGGQSLSSGQRQRVAIAQAFLRSAEILILDEATSALDSQSEEAVADGLAELRRGRTTILIAHRYSSLKSASRVVYFNGDGTVTVGQHDELIAAHAGYRTAVEWQTAPSPPL
jgi:ABC-type multidrug transport system fused ATPase/permease subunit